MIANEAFRTLTGQTIKKAPAVSKTTGAFILLKATGL
jgi:hypothetical protein